MTVTLTQEELIQAVEEWCERRSIAKGNEIVIHATHVKGGQSTQPTSRMTEYRMQASIHGVENPVKEGPYR